MNLIIDEGNTFVKIAVFDRSKMIDFKKVSGISCQEEIDKWIVKYKFKNAIVSSVTGKTLNLFRELDIEFKHLLSYKLPVPFKNLYKTPKTLGVDRIALMAGAYAKYPSKNCLVIDAGTCITYDFIDCKGNYRGGAISPGIEMRFKSMCVFTEKLPQLSLKEEIVCLEGLTTESSMYSGVVNGTVFEIQGMINSYEQKYGNVNIILTGGNANLLCKQLKNGIFVNRNFLLEGLNEVLTYQSNK